MKKLYYPVIFHPEDVGFSTIVPDIEGCFSQGDDMDEAVAMTQDAIGLMLEDIIFANGELPRPSSPKSIAVEDEDFLVMVEFDALAYRKRIQPQAVKKTLTIPAWLNHMAEAQGVNFSNVLQKALKQELHIQ